MQMYRSAGSGETVQICGEVSIFRRFARKRSALRSKLEAQPSEVRGGGTRTMSRSSSGLERADLGKGQRRRRQPSAVEARVGSRDGARSSSRSTTTGTTSSSCWTMQGGHGQCPLPTYKPPYMDVQTVKTNLTVDQAARLEGQSHCLLLVEPVLFPDLGHTGVTREVLPGDRPLFYPNGCKNRGLGAIVRNSLYHSTSAPRLKAGNSKVFDRTQQQTTHSDCPVRREPLSSRGSSLADHRSVAPTSLAIPAGQGGSLSLPPDAWETPRVAGAEVSRRKPGTARTLSRGAADKRTTEKQVRAGQHGGRAVPKGFLAARAAGATRARHQEQQQQQQQQQRSKSTNLPPADPKHSAGTSSTITAPISDCFHYDGADPTGLDAAGRDSEWVAERRSADAETRELLGALKRNSSRLWFLVGGGV